MSKSAVEKGCKLYKLCGMCAMADVLV